MIRRDLQAPRPARRSILQGAAGWVLAWMTPVPAAAQDARAARPAAGDLLVRTSDKTLAPLAPDDIPVAATPVIAWAMEPGDQVVRNGTRLNRVLLVRLDPDVLGEKTRSLAAEGVVAYSAICTHTGCDVGTWLDDEQVLYCECHESKFDPRDNAHVIDGPAPRSLPALPLKVVDGRLVVAGPFTSKVGFESG
ncbi:MAG: ubiquinol-cytochrome c reductase iron-sulfur subunit [Vicinamibacterales bacterium]